MNARLDTHAERLEDWFENEQISPRTAKRRLGRMGCDVGEGELRRWWRQHKAAQEEQHLLECIAQGAKQCRELEAALVTSGSPELETLIRLHRVLILKLSTEAASAPKLLRAVADLMRPVMAWASLEEKRRSREFIETRYREQVEAQKAAISREIQSAQGSGGISAETLERVERELKLL